MTVNPTALNLVKMLLEHDPASDDLSRFSNGDLEMAKMYCGLVESTLELELSDRYGKPIDVAEEGHIFSAVPEPPNFRATCSCSWKDRRLVPSEKQAEYAWRGNHEVTIKRG